MTSKKVYLGVVETLEASRAGIRCDELAGLLTRLGFEVKDGKRGGHKTFFHNGVPEFTSGSYNCGHGKNPEIRPAYTGKILKIIHKYETELIAFLESGESND